MCASATNKFCAKPTATLASPEAMRGSHANFTASTLSALMSGTATNTVSTKGSGSATKPQASASSTKSTAFMPMPPNSSGTVKPVKPMPAIACHKSSLRPLSVSHRARIFSGVTSFTRNFFTSSWNNNWSSLKVKSIVVASLSAAYRACARQ